VHDVSLSRTLFKKALQSGNRWEERDASSSRSFSSRGSLPAGSLRVHVTTMLPELTCIMSRYRFLVHIREMWKWSSDNVAKATNLIDCYDETQNNRTRGSTVSGSQNHRAAVLNSILYNRFVVRWFSRPARYAWLLSQWNCRYCTFFFFFKATPIAAEGATLPTVCRLPVVPGCTCVRFWRAIIELNIILIVIMIYYSHYGYESAKSREILSNFYCM